MSQRLYYDDSYLAEFDATVVGHAPGGRLYLDRSAFYPTSGGQQFDRGSLRLLQPDPSQPGVSLPGLLRPDNKPALDVIDVIDEGERVAHVLADQDAVSLPLGARLTGQIDWARRFDHMQQHSGQHLLSAVFQQLVGAGTLSVHFGVDSSTLDLDLGALTHEQLLAVEERANALVFENRSVTTRLEAAGAEGLRRESKRSGPLRVVDIAALDRSACGGTHVARTGEIGPLLLRKLERVRKAVRVEFLCGGRAARRARADYDTLAGLGALVSTSVDGVLEVMSKRLAELGQQSAALRVARESLDGYRSAELYAHARAAAGPEGVALHVERTAEVGLQELRGLAQGYIRHRRAVFLAVLAEPPSILLAASEDTGIDAGAVLKAALASAAGRGGGSARLAQGTVGDAAAAANVLVVLSERLRGVASR
jgi:alanyl-tRNA synthetase